MNFSRRNVAVIPPKDTMEMQLRVSDWRRLYRKVRGINPGFSGRELFAGIAWGITGSAFFTLFQIYQSAQSSQSIEPWVKPALFSILVASLVVGLVIFFGTRSHTREVKADRDEILIDMRDIHRVFFPTEDLEAEPIRPAVDFREPSLGSSSNCPNGEAKKDPVNPKCSDDLERSNRHQ